MKKLKIAEIVPVNCLELTASNQYHMCLAHLVSTDGEQAAKYTDFYKKMSALGAYVLMDNGAAENSQLNFDELIATYKKINPTEIVLPDVLCDSQATIERTCDFYSKYKDDIKDYKLMVVPQGNTFKEWCECAAELIKNIPVNTIGVSKFLEMETGESDIRVRACEFLKNYNVEIHLLGCSEGPRVVKEARSVNTNVRGCDSAFVYICSKAELDHIDLDTKRVEGEIDFLNDPFNSRLSGLMLDFEQAAGVENNSRDNTWEV